MSASPRLAGVRWWTDDEIAADAAAARAEFRRRRLAEPLQRYLDAHAAVSPAVAAWVEAAQHLLGPGPAAPESALDLLATEEQRTTLRYLGAPPISADDLSTLAEVQAAGKPSPAQVDRVLDVMRAILDPLRFPWVRAGTMPSRAQRHAAELATSVLIASQRVQTLRRGDEGSSVEGAVRGLLIGMGWQQAAPRERGGVQVLVTDAPASRTFNVQTNLGSDNADVLVRLDDGRLLAIECKGSNSEINSRKRLNKEAAQNARAWLARFGSDQVVPAVAMQGVFKPRYVAEVQATPMAIFWGHRLDDLREFIQRCERPATPRRRR